MLGFVYEDLSVPVFVVRFVTLSIVLYQSRHLKYHHYKQHNQRVV